MQKYRFQRYRYQHLLVLIQSTDGRWYELDPCVLDVLRGETIKAKRNSLLKAAAYHGINLATCISTEGVLSVRMEDIPITDSAIAGYITVDGVMLINPVSEVPPCS
jgi:hypothetical protein